jgi:hypothetical protein
MLILFSKWLALSDAQHFQRLSPDGMETLLDHHLATFDGWLQRHLMYLPALSRSHSLAVVALLDQLGPKEYNWPQLSPILEGTLSLPELLDQLDPKVDWLLLEKFPRFKSPKEEMVMGHLNFLNLHDLFHGIKSNIEFSQIVSKFLVDQNRAGSLWVNLHSYVNLATQLLDILHDR